MIPKLPRIFWRLIVIAVFFLGVVAIILIREHETLFVSAPPRFEVREAGFGFDFLLPALLDIHPGSAIATRFGNTAEELSRADWEPVRPLRWWWLPTGIQNKEVYAEFRDYAGKVIERRIRIPSNMTGVSAPCLQIFQPDPSCALQVPRREKIFLSRPAAETESFNNGPAFWQTYLYDDANPNNVFYPVTWRKNGGVENSGYVSTDHSRWAIDTPEDPDSVLAFVLYRDWLQEAPLDLRGAAVSMFLRGDNLDLGDAKAYFWVLDKETNMRWHYTGDPLTVTAEKWGEKIAITLASDPEQWHNSWSRPPEGKAAGTLDDVLAGVDSYGISFVGFLPGDEPTGWLSLDELSLDFVD